MGTRDVFGTTTVTSITLSHLRGDGLSATTFSSQPRVRRYGDGRCVGNYSNKSAVCELCFRGTVCAETTMKMATQTGSKEFNPTNRLCRKCKHVVKNSVGEEYNQCRCPNIWSGTVRRRYCSHERAEPFDGHYVMCGEEGRLWEIRPPTAWDKLKARMARMARHVLGPEEHRAKQKQQGGLFKFLREAIKGPEKVESGGCKNESDSRCDNP